ncbi:MAG: HyaD/HybD family hydrogenase maturation endopeptidase [Thiobacillaceae bacterium]|jgi:hydrogenase maturation protease|nr:HyaD/HybD family hydrogenase maturation endopeptidase [Thiobacillaceae bacterium]
MRAVVLGVGNLLLSDEGLGVRAVERLQRDYALSPEVVVLDGGTCGMELLDDLAGADLLIIVDALHVGRPPGSLVRLVNGEVPALLRQKLSPHQVGLSDVLANLALLDQSPGTIVVHGMEPVSLDTGMELSPLIAAGLPRLVTAVAGELAGHDLAPVPRPAA